MNLVIADPEKKREIKDITAYISSLPEFERWVDSAHLKPELITAMRLVWIYLGKAIDAFFNDEPNPTDSPYLQDWLKDILKAKVPIYTSLTVLLFDAEKYIKEEAVKEGWDFVKSWKRSDMLKYWAYEESRYEVDFWLQDFWESDTSEKTNDRIQRAAMYLLGEVSEERNKLELERWAREAAKLYRPQELPFEEMCPWFCFCMNVFKKYKDELPTYKGFISAMSSVRARRKKIVLENQEIKDYPGRGKGKGKGKGKS
jgi:hypothetical protein